MANFDLKRLSGLDWGVAGGGALAFIALFLPWYGASYLGFSSSVSGWSTSYGWLGGLLMVGAGAYLLIHRAVDLSKMSIGPGVAVLGISALGVLIVIIRWLTLPSGHYGAGSAVFSYGPQAGIYLALIAGIVQVVCAVLLFRASGESMPWADKKASAPGAPPQASGPPPGPATSMPPPAASSMPPQPPPAPPQQPPGPQPG